jgi:hypothetical protein
MQLTNGTCFKQCLGLNQTQSSPTATNYDDLVFHGELGQQVRTSDRINGRGLEDSCGMHGSTSGGS